MKTNKKPDINFISELASKALQTDGAHHKQYFLAQIIKEIDFDAYLALVELDIDTGIAP